MKQTILGIGALMLASICFAQVNNIKFNYDHEFKMCGAPSLLDSLSSEPKAYLDCPKRWTQWSSIMRALTVAREQKQKLVVIIGRNDCAGCVILTKKLRTEEGESTLRDLHQIAVLTKLNIGSDDRTTKDVLRLLNHDGRTYPYPYVLIYNPQTGMNTSVQLTEFEISSPEIFLSTVKSGLLRNR